MMPMESKKTYIIYFDTYENKYRSIDTIVPDICGYNKLRHGTNLAGFHAGVG